MKAWILVLAACGSNTPQPVPVTPAPAPVVIDAGTADAAIPDAASIAVVVVEPPPATPTTTKSITVGLTLDTVVSERPPTLVVTVENHGSAPVPFPTIAGAPCFAFYNLTIALTRPGGKRSTPSARCKSPKVVAGSIAANASARVLVPLAELFDGLKPGRYAIELEWNPDELAKLEGEAGVVRATTQSASDQFTIAKVLATVRAERKKPITLPGGVTFEFTAHGHKHVMAGGPSSPLIIAGTITEGKRAPIEFSVNVQMDESKLFSTEGDHVFEIVDYKYDDYMKLRYFGRIKPAD